MMIFLRCFFDGTTMMSILFHLLFKKKRRDEFPNKEDNGERENYRKLILQNTNLFVYIF